MRLGYDRMSLGGRPGPRSMYEFRQDDHILSFSQLPQGQGYTSVRLHPETLQVEPLRLGALTVGMADLLEFFGRGLHEGRARDASLGLISTLRDVFDPSGPRQADVSRVERRTRAR